MQALVAGGHDVGVCFSRAGTQVAGQELYGDLRMPRDQVIEQWCAETGITGEQIHALDDYASPYASGSALWDAAAIVPCSMDTLATIAAGAGTTLLHRAAGVALKEQRKLILVPRETPLSTIHLENMLRVRNAGAQLLPAMPGFYHRPTTVDELIDFVVGKILNLLGAEQTLLRRWDERGA